GAAQLRDQDGAAAHDLRGDADGLEGGRRHPGLRARLAVRPLRADPQRCRRAVPRRVDDADGDGDPDNPAAVGADGGRQHLPPPRRAGEDGGNARRHQRRSARPRPRRRLERLRAREHGHPPLPARRADPPLRRGVRADQAALHPADDRLRRPLLSIEGGALRAEAGPAAVAAVRPRRRRREADAADRGRARRRLELRRRHRRGVHPQGGHPARALRRGRPQSRRDHALDAATAEVRRSAGGRPDAPAIRRRRRHPPRALPAAPVPGGHRAAAGGRSGGPGAGI
ncbi:MAG: Coenzyme F420-dependent oxidoreductase, partial [uncultured Thermomicrobiales bacterium]